MPYFPFFADITGQPCLIVGGGRIALHKIRKLLPFSPEIHVVAEDISPEISSLRNCILPVADLRTATLTECAS